MKRRRSQPQERTEPRGGIRQRLASRRCESELPPHSALCKILLTLFSWGEISPQLCQTIAAAAMEDAEQYKDEKTSLKDLSTIAHIGSDGQHAHKCYGDLMARMPLSVRLPLPTVSHLPFKEPCSNMLQAFMLLHELFAAIWNHYPHTWKKCIVEGEETLRTFWRSNAGHPAFSSSGLEDIPDYDSCCVPIGFHGDDVPITGINKSRAQGMTVFSWSSLVGVGETRDKQYLIYSCWEKLRAVEKNQSHDTLGRFFTILVWSLSWLRAGTWPDRDWQGKKILGFGTII